MEEQVSLFDPLNLELNQSKSGELTRCEFCNKSFTSDFDIAQHLSDARHRDKLNIYKENLKKEHSKTKVPRRHFRGVLQLLKIRNKSEITTLVERGFFNVATESLADISQVMAQVLLKSIVEYELRNFDPTARQALMKALSGESVIDSQTSSESEEETQESTHLPSQITTDLDPDIGSPSNNSKYDDYMPAPSTSYAQSEAMVKQEPQTLSHVDEIEQQQEPCERLRDTRGETHDFSEPRPDPTSTYVPQLAKIKVEPQDD